MINMGFISQNYKLAILAVFCFVAKSQANPVTFQGNPEALAALLADYFNFEVNPNDLNKPDVREYVEKMLQNLPHLSPLFEAYLSGQCYRRNQGSTQYTGRLSTTISGYTCQPWIMQTPNQHEYTDPNAYPDRSLLQAYNFCRDPSNSGFVWCYTTNPEKRWENCDVTRCSLSDKTDMCFGFNERSIDYSGERNQTYTGKTCQDWSSQYPHSHEYTNGTRYPEGSTDGAQNFCRDPDNWGQPWCYTTDPDTRWEVCDVAKCVFY